MSCRYNKDDAYIDLHSTMYLLNLKDSAKRYKSKSFTFHYVSIKSSITTLDGVVVSDLHSTMYLLNLITSTMLTHTHAYLHSTMYLLNLKRQHIKHYFIKFTFHYVSIKSYPSYT